MTLDKTSRVAIMYSEYVTYAKANDKDITDYGGRFLLRYNFSAGHAVLEETMRYTIPVDFTGDYMVYNTQGTLLGYMSIYSNGSAWIENTNFNNARVTISINSYNVEDNTTISIPSDQIAAVYDHYSGTDVELYGSTVYLYVDTNSMSAVMECDYIEDRMLLRNTTNCQFEILTQDNRVVGYVTVFGDQSSRVTISGSDYHFTLPSFDYVNENGEVSFAYYNVSMYYRDVYCESTYALTYRFDFLNGDCYVESPHVSAAIFTTAYFEALDEYGNFIGYLSVQSSDYNKFTIRLDYDDKDCYFYATNINVGAFTESGFIIYSNELYVMPNSDSDRVNQPSSNLVVTYGSEPYVVIVDYYFEGISVW
jgi:hypothetical protein